MEESKNSRNVPGTMVDTGGCPMHIPPPRGGSGVKRHNDDPPVERTRMTFSRSPSRVLTPEFT